MRRLAATVAAFGVVVGGASWAAADPPRDALALKKNSVTSKSIKNGQVKGADVKDNGLTGADIDEATLEGVGGGPQGAPTGTAGGDLAGTYPNPTLAPLAVGTDEISNGAITVDKLSFDPATQGELTWGNLNGIPAGFADGVDDDGSGNYWSLAGNAGTNPASHFLGTTDDQSLNLRVNDLQAFQLEPGADPSNPVPNVIGGSAANSTSPGADGATIAGGNGNTASGDGATVAGGFQNTAAGLRATAVGGEGNSAGGDFSFAAGRRADADHDGSFVWGDSTDAGVGSGGVNSFTARASSGYRFFSSSDTTGANAPGLQIPAGESALSTRGTQALALKPGGSSVLRLEPNAISPHLIGGHQNNSVTGAFAGTIAGGGLDSGQENRVTDAGGTVGGGVSNRAGDGAGTNLDRNWITVSGGASNTASGQASTVGGGVSNLATGAGAAIPGGTVNTAAGALSFAAGCEANATHDGAFVWDGECAGTSSTGDNTFTVHAPGGSTIYTDATNTTGAELPAGSGAWSALSDRRAKQGFEPARSRSVLARLADLPISTWRYRSEQGGVRHIGPTAQDFADAFGVGPDRRHISTVDADGVALAAIKGLDGVVRKQQRQIDALERRLGRMERGSG